MKLVVERALGLICTDKTPSTRVLRALSVLVYECEWDDEGCSLTLNGWPGLVKDLDDRHRYRQTEDNPHDDGPFSFLIAR